MVRTGSTSSQKSLFFNMRRVRARLEREAATGGHRHDRHLMHQKIARELGVPLRDVEMMEGRLAGSDFSLNASQTGDEDGREWIETLEDPRPPQSQEVERNKDNETLRGWLEDAMATLNDRERLIVRERKLRDKPRTLSSLGQELRLSKERVRQLEALAFAKMRERLEARLGDVRRFFS